VDLGNKAKVSFELCLFDQDGFYDMVTAERAAVSNWGYLFKPGKIKLNICGTF
jgi:hypothetical protein